MGRLNVCPRCRAFFDPGLRECPHCGTSIVPRRVRERGGWFDRLASRGLEVTLLIIGANVVLYAAEVFASGGIRAEGGIWGLGAVDPEVVYRFGALRYRSVVEGGEWWRLVCATFLHFSLLHIAFNVYAIRLAGRVAEEAFGPAKFLTLYLLAGLAGSVSSVLWNGPGLWWGAGASGAAFGTIGMAAVYALRTKNDALWRWMSQWVIFALVITFLPGLGADNAAHLGGLAAGALLGYRAGYASRTRLSPRAVRAWDLAGLGSAALVLLCFLLALAAAG